MITICLDLGNTRKKYAIFNASNLVETAVLRDDILVHLTEVLNTHKPEKSILSSVIHHDIEIENLLSLHSSFHKLNHQSKLPILTPVGKPETIGADRLAICSAATKLFQNKHALVISLGTCVTYNFVNKFSEFLGGSISPGMMMRFKSMNDYTALLPIVEATHQFPLIGFDTKTNLQSGVLLGLAKELDGFIDLYNEKYDDLQIVITGGDALFFSSHLKNKILFEPNLLFKGLLEILKLN